MSAPENYSRTVGNLQGALQAMAKEFNNSDLSMPRMLVFLEVAQRGEMTHIELSRALGYPKATISRNVVLLSRLGLLTNYEYDDDRRYRTIALTKRGQSALNRILNHLSVKGGDNNVD
ncbi:winged helix DNA-binding protein [Oxalobacter vibrioformis]|uniref:Winged helix DNA-binding protein n=1 Tax=Oxalobacter vibrioformis TaxID=933080 RepID=A0A9E9P4E9_9BURK|nr:MarR family transcriptional regulator [Oxalobacter vibrioformis]WAW10021.1 winged helix DNA-binding protein [Oxalobacter vibrioformis]